MPSIITAAGETAIAQKQAAEENLVISTLKFFNINVGGENPTTPDPADVEPDPQYLVHTAALTAAGFINPNAVVYSTLLDSSVGDFTFTWIGWYTAEGVLFAITHTTPQYKKQTTGEQTGNNFTRNLIFPFSGAQVLTGIVVPAETWQLDFTERFESAETENRKTNRALYGRAAFLNDSFKITAIPPNTEDDCEALTGWTLSGGSGTIVLDSVEFTEGANSLKASGQVADAEMVKDVSTAPRDWSSKNGLILDLLGDSATNLAFFIEDSLARRNKWNLVNQTAWKTHELKLEAPDVAGGCDYADVCKFGLEGLDNGVIYHIDAIKTCRFNDFQIEAGEAFLEGIRLDEALSTYQGHLLDYNNVGTAVDAISPPGAGTRTDNVYLDVHIQGDFNTIAPYIEIKVTGEVLADNIDGNGYQHYLEKIAEIKRTTSEQVVLFNDYRRKQAADESGVLGKINVSLGVVPHVVPYTAHPFIEGIDGDATAFAALSDHENMPGVKVDSKGRIRFWTTIRGRKPILMEIGAKSGMDRFDLDSLQPLDDEFGPNGEPVYAVDGRDSVRAIGDWLDTNDANGNAPYSDADLGQLEIVGYFDKINISNIANTAPRILESIVNGNSQTAITTFQTNILSPKLGRFLDDNSYKALQLDSALSLQLNTIHIVSDGNHYNAFSVEFGIDSDQVTVLQQEVVAQGKKKTVAFGQISQKPDVWAANYGKPGYDGEHDQGLDKWGIGENVAWAVADHDAASSQYAATPLNVFDWVVDTTDVAAYQILNPFKVSGIHQAINGSTHVNWSSPYSYVALPASGGAVTVGTLYYSATYNKLYKCIQSGTITYATQADIDNSGIFAYRIPTNGFRTVIASYDGIVSSTNRARATRWLPPAARHIGNSAIDERSSGQQRPVFEAGSVDFEGQELVEVCNNRIWGNGDKNGDSAYGFDTIPSTGSNDRAFVRDDGLDALVCKGLYCGSGYDWGLTPQAVGDHYTRTFIGTGLMLHYYMSYAASVQMTSPIISNLPFGTYVVKCEYDTGVTKIYVDNVLVDTQADWFAVINFKTYQPKQPDLPEGTCIISDYMGMADAVAPTEVGNLVIGKGVRRVHATRDVFYDQSVVGGTDWTLSGVNPTRIGGWNSYVGNAAKDNWCELPFFGEDITIRPQNDTGSLAAITIEIDGSTNLSGFKVTTGGGFSISDLATGAFTIDQTVNTGCFINISGLTAGNHKVKYMGTTGVGNYMYMQAFDLYPGIHRSNHYKKLTYNPYVSPELVGGGDGINNDNIVVSGDGRTFENVRGPDKPELPLTALFIGRNAGGNSNLSSINMHFRRGMAEGISPMYSRGWMGIAAGPQNALCLVDGEYTLIYQITGLATAGWVYLSIPGGTIRKAYIEGEEGQNLTYTGNFKRGDLISIGGSVTPIRDTETAFCGLRIIKGKGTA